MTVVPLFVLPIRGGRRSGTQNSAYRPGSYKRAATGQAKEPPGTALRRASFEQPIDREQDNRAHHRHDESCCLAFLIPAHRAAWPACEQGAGNSQQHLELSRAELLERIRFGYQTLIVYAGGVGAIALWAHPSQLAPASVQVSLLHPWSANARLVPIGVIVAFLAAVTEWVMHQNEHIVSLLAPYQSQTLAKHLIAALPEGPLWELSPQLKRDNPKYVS